MNAHKIQLSYIPPPEKKHYPVYTTETIQVVQHHFQPPRLLQQSLQELQIHIRKVKDVGYYGHVWFVAPDSQATILVKHNQDVSKMPVRLRLLNSSLVVAVVNGSHISYSTSHQNIVNVGLGLLIKSQGI